MGSRKIIDTQLYEGASVINDPYANHSDNDKQVKRMQAAAKNQDVIITKLAVKGSNG